MNRRILIALAVSIPLLLFVVARQAALRRPVLIGTHAGARALTLSHDGTRLFSHSTRDTKIWDTQTRARVGGWPLASLEEVPSPDGQRLAKGRARVLSNNGQTVQTWLEGEVRDARNGAQLHTFNDIWRHSIYTDDVLHDLQWSKDGRQIVTLTNSALRRFDARDGHLLKRVPYPAQKGFTSWKLAPDGAQIVASDRKGTYFFDAVTGKQRRFWPHPSAATRAFPIGVLALSPDNRWLLSTQRRGRGGTNALLFQNARDGSIVWQKMEFGAGGAYFKFCGFSGDGRLVLALENARVVALASDSGRELWHFDAPLAQDAVLSSDGRFVYWLELAGAIRRWKVPSFNP